MLISTFINFIFLLNLSNFKETEKIGIVFGVFFWTLLWWRDHQNHLKALGCSHFAAFPAQPVCLDPTFLSVMSIAVRCFTFLMIYIQFSAKSPFVGVLIYNVASLPRVKQGQRRVTKVKMSFARNIWRVKAWPNVSGASETWWKRNRKDSNAGAKEKKMTEFPNTEASSMEKREH